MPRVPGEEGKKKEPPAYMGDPNATVCASTQKLAPEPNVVWIHKEKAYAL